MAAVVVQSRFAGLKIEDDDISSSETQKARKIKTNSVKKIEPAKKPKNNITSKPQNGSKKRKPKPSAATAEQWETWKQKDEELVDGNFETELQQAILLSKLDFEEKKDVYKQLKKDADSEKKAEQSRSSNKKNKKKNVMSLDQFNDLVNVEDSKLTLEDDKNTPEEIKSPDKDTTFFERVKDETKHELLKDKIIDRVKHQTVQDEIITRVHFVNALEKKDEEIAALKQEVIKLKGELLTVKTRNKKLCSILGQGEMKDKAEVLVEVERLRAMQVELNAELTSLHSDLEKERSKNADPRTKDKKKRSANGDKEK